MESSIETEQRAAAWLAKRDGGEWTEDDERQLKTWLDQSTAHTVAYIRLETGWNEARRLRALGAGVPPGIIPTTDQLRLSPFFDQPAASPAQPALEANAHRRVGTRRSIASAARLGAIAASVVIAIIAGTAWYLRPSGPTYSTPVGGVTSVPMTDGSKITLNTDSQIRLVVTTKERLVQLEHGEAFFEVAKDSTRPFVVSAGIKRIVAIGTKFSVRREGDDVRVFVTEGKVRSGDILLTAGSVARSTDESFLVQTKALPIVEEYLSWRSGYLVFRETPLAEAIAEFNRYNDRKIVIQDPAVAAVKLSGKFRSTNFEAFVRLLEDGYAIHAQRSADHIILTDTAAQ